MKRAKKFVLASQEGIDFAASRLKADPQMFKVGDEASLELDDDRQEQALLAAAWLKDPKEKEG